MTDFDGPDYSHLSTPKKDDSVHPPTQSFEGPDPNYLSPPPPPAAPSVSPPGFLGSLVAGLRGFNNKFFGLGDASEYIGSRLGIGSAPPDVTMDQATERGQKVAAEHPYADFAGGIAGEATKAVPIMKGISAAVPALARSGFLPTVGLGAATGAGTSAIDQTVDAVKKGELPSPGEAIGKMGGSTAGGAIGGVLGHTLAPLISSAARIGQLIGEPLSDAARGAVKQGASFAKDLGVSLDLPRAMRYAGGEAKQAAPAIEGLLGRLKNSETAGARVGANDAYDAAQNPATSLYRQAAPDKLTPTPQPPFVRQAMRDVRNSPGMVEDVRTDMGLPPGSPVPTNSVGFMDRVAKQVPEVRGVPEDIAERNAGALRDIIKGQSPQYRVASDTHKAYKELGESITGPAPKVDEPDSIGLLMRNLPFARSHWDKSAHVISNPRTTSKLMNPESVDLLGKSAPIQRVPGLLGAPMGEEAVDEWRNPKKRRKQ